MAPSSSTRANPTASLRTANTSCCSRTGATRDPHAIQRKLLIESDIYNRHRRTVGDLLRDAKRDGWPATRADRAMGAGCA